MKRALLLIGIVGLSSMALAQQDPQFSQNMFNRLFINPGVAGSNHAICVTTLYRHQWTGFDGNPRTDVISVHGPFRLAGINGGLGLNVLADRLGQEKTFGAKGDLAYRRSIFGGLGDLGIGISAGIINKSIGSDWRTTSGTAQDGTEDAAINNNKEGKTGFDMDAGVYYKSDKLYVGLSASHLTQSNLEKTVTGTPPTGYSLDYLVARHYYIMAGYSHDLSSTLTIKPMVLAKTDAASAIIDINVIVLYNNMFFGGVSYRLNDAVVPMLGAYYPLGPGTAKFGYSYDVTTSLLRKYSNGSHEIMLGYCFNIPDKDKVQRHKTVRFL